MSIRIKYENLPFSTRFDLCNRYTAICVITNKQSLYVCVGEIGTAGIRTPVDSLC